MKKMLSVILVMCLFFSFGGVGEAAVIFNDNQDTGDYIKNEDLKYALEVDQIGIDELEIQPYVLPLLIPAASVLANFIVRQGVKKAMTNWSKTIVATLLCSSPAVVKAVAKDLGYAEVKGQFIHGEKIFKAGKKAKGPKYISVDADGHKKDNAWKGASSIKNLVSKKTRSGTYDAGLKRIGD